MQETLSILIPDGESSLALFVAHCLSSVPNVKVHALSTDRWAPLRFSRRCHSFSFVPHAHDSNRWMDAIAGAVKRHRVDVLLPVDTQAIPFAIANRAALSEFVAVAPLPDQRAFDVANNKWLMAGLLAANEIASPPSLLVDNSDGFFRELQALKFPVLLKPTGSRGGDGIRQFDTLGELRHFLEAKPPRTQDQCIVQSVMPGIDVSINILAREGHVQVITAQQGIVPNSQKFGAPGGLEFVDDECFRQVAEKLTAALPWNGYVNVDTLWSAASSVQVLDINARFWASVRGSWVAGVNFPHLACLAALGVPFDAPAMPTTRYFHGKTAVRQFISSLLRRHRPPNLHETDLNFLIDDPAAEAVRIFYQEILDK